MCWEVDARALAPECQARKIPIRRKFPTKATADDWARELMARIEREPKTRIEVRALCDHFLRSREVHVREDTMRGYRTGTRRLMSFCTASGITYVDQLNRAAVGEYVDHLRATVSKRTAAQYLVITSVCFSWGVQRGYLSRNPFAGLGRRTRKTSRRILTDKERDTIINQAPLADLWTFMLGTGCRVIEVVGIETDDVRIKSPQPHVRVVGKGGKVRTIPMGPEVAQAAARLLAAGDGRIWPGGSRRALSSAWASDRDTLGLPKDITMHSFRHDYASWLVNVERLPLPDVQRVLGHSDLATTAIYLHPDGRRLSEAVTGRSRSLRWKQNGNSEREAP